MVTVKMSRGRQKVDMVKMSNENNLQVTFSKRRVGLFKKSSELCTLTGSELAVVVFSPGNKAYSFGSPSVNQIIERYETQAPHFISPPGMINEAQHTTNELSLNQELRSMEDYIDVAKKRSDELTEMVKANRNRYWWQAPINELNVEQLEMLKLAYEELDKRVQIQAQKGLPPNANLFPDFNISGPSDSYAFPAYESQPPPTPPNTIHPALPLTTNFVGLTLSNDGLSVKHAQPSSVDHQEQLGPGTNSVTFNVPNASGW